MTYKTTGKGFYNNNLNKKKKLLSDKIYSANQKRGISNNINQKYYTSNNFYINNQRINNENNIIKLLQQKINEIESNAKKTGGKR